MKTASPKVMVVANGNLLPQPIINASNTHGEQEDHDDGRPVNAGQSNSIPIPKSVPSPMIRHYNSQGSVKGGASSISTTSPIIGRLTTMSAEESAIEARLSINSSASSIIVEQVKRKHKSPFQKPKQITRKVSSIIQLESVNALEERQKRESSARETRDDSSDEEEGDDDDDAPLYNDSDDEFDAEEAAAHARARRTQSNGPSSPSRTMSSGSGHHNNRHQSQQQQQQQGPIGRSMSSGAANNNSSLPAPLPSTLQEIATRNNRDDERRRSSSSSTITYPNSPKIFNSRKSEKAKCSIQ